jgi:16S rRNA (cytidine1402-2'-O)-methyltransferase
VDHANNSSDITPGTLYVVSTPIGNLEDITYRAIRVLNEVDMIIAEDTRRSKKLLSHYEISTPFGPSFYEGTDEKRLDKLLDQLVSGKNLALITDAGTPLLQDPGYPLVRGAVEREIPIVAIPGASALLTALVSSGIPTDHFIFDGIPTKKEGRRRTYFESLVEESRTVVLYESPHRILKTLQTIYEVLPERQIVLCRELTKMHEEIIRGTPAELLENFENRASIKGEFVMIITGEPRVKE